MFRSFFPSSARWLWPLVALFLGAGAVVVLRGVFQWHASAAARFVAEEDVLADEFVRRVVAQLPMGWLIAFPPGSSTSTPESARTWYQVYGAGAGGEAWVPDSVWSQVELERASQHLGSMSHPNRRVGWVRRAAAGQWGEGGVEAASRLPLLSGYGDLLMLSRLFDLDLVAHRFTESGAVRPGPTRHFQHLLDAMALTGSVHLAKSESVAALRPLADGLHMTMLWATNTPSPVEARAALEAFADFLEAYLVAAEVADSAMGRDLRAYADSLAQSAVPSARPSPFWSPAAYVAAIVADSALDRDLAAAVYFRGVVAGRVASCGASFSAPPSYPHEASWPLWARPMLRPEQGSCVPLDAPFPWNGVAAIVAP